MGGHRGNAEVNVVVGWGDPRGAAQCPRLNQDHRTISSMLINTGGTLENDLPPCSRTLEHAVLVMRPVPPGSISFRLLVLLEGEPAFMLPEPLY